MRKSTLKKNQVIENPVIGDKGRILITSEDSNGEFVRAELWCKPGAQGTPLHYHPLQSEYFEVVKGKLGVHHNGEDVVLLPGQKVTIEKNTIHRFWNASQDEEVLVILELRPALNFEFAIETIYSLAMQKKANKDGMPRNPLQLAAILHDNPGELYLMNPPVFVQKFMEKVVGRFAKFLGYKGYIPYPVDKITFSDKPLV